MEGKREPDRERSEDSGRKQPIGQDSSRGEFDRTGQQGEIGEPGADETIGGGTLGAGQSGGFGNQVSAAPQGSTGDLGKSDSIRQQDVAGTGQWDLGSQAGSTLAGHSDQQDLGQDQAASYGSQSPDSTDDRDFQRQGQLGTLNRDTGTAGAGTDTAGRQGEGFIGQRGTSDDSYLREDTGDQDFASQGQGALDENASAAPSRSEDEEEDGTNGGNI